MAVYSELIKNFEKVREYVRDFYIFGFHTRESFDAKSKRTYDNEKRRIESWLSDHVHTSLEGHKKKVSVQVDSGNIFQNPLYQCYRSKTFTDNDIRLHFILMDALEDNAMSVSEIADYISANYGMIIDVQIIRIKLKEYVKEGLVSEVKSGRNILYTKTGCYADDIVSRYKGLGDLRKTLLVWWAALSWISWVRKIIFLCVSTLTWCILLMMRYSLISWEQWSRKKLFCYPA